MYESQTVYLEFHTYPTISFGKILYEWAIESIVAVM
jgi:hypothetical protein